MVPDVHEMLEKNVLWLSIIVKIIVLSFVTNDCDPDGNWQNLEVAHLQAFEYGYRTWEWRSMTQSYIYPFIISIIYKILAIVGLDYPLMIIYSPRIFQAVLSVFAEYRFLKWTNSPEAASLLVLNGFWQFCSTKTLNHTLEASLMIIALSIYPWEDKDKHGSKFIWLMDFMFFIRPTSAIMCAPLYIRHMYYSNKTIKQLIKDYFFIGMCVSGIAIAIDSCCYGQLVVTPWEFFKTNIFTGIGNHYETKYILWYIYSTIPYFLGFGMFTLPFVFMKLFFNEMDDERQETSIIIFCWTILWHSLLPHREHHFLLSLLPLLVFLSAKFEWCDEVCSELISRIIILVTIIINIGIFYSFANDRSGSTEIMSYLREEIASSPSNVDVMFLTPCYSTPLYSHVHEDIPMELLNCEPNLKNQDNYLNEADIFFNDPMAWLEKRYTNSTLPFFVVMYDNLAPRIKGFVDNYHLVVSVFDSFYPSTNRGNNLNLYKLK
ncbi:GPI mannosyltransferase 3-like [Cotesia glomerata]|uniref:GPI mannosyltransferase 3-like n=1 Tax=Cotesia glomerata TaxID=32391 RepID=UPI001D03263B|nr:GPI mannosyltransferase 3-like [Cotesia glomerata]